MHPAHLRTRFPTADKSLHLPTASDSSLAERRRRLTLVKGLET